MISYESYPSCESSYDVLSGVVASSYDVLSGVVAVTEGLVPVVVLSVSGVVVVKEGLTPIVVLSGVVNEGPDADAVMARPPESRLGLSWVLRLQVKG